MYWIHGRLGDRLLTRYGPYKTIETALRVIRHIREVISFHGGINLDYYISRRKKT